MYFSQETDCGNFTPQINFDWKKKSSKPTVQSRVNGVETYFARLNRGKKNGTVRTNDKECESRFPVGSPNGRLQKEKRTPISQKVRPQTTMPISPFSRDNEVNNTMQKKVKGNKQVGGNLQDNERELLRQKQQDDHSAFLEKVTFDPNNTYMNNLKYSDAVNQLHNQLLQLELETEQFPIKKN